MTISRVARCHGTTRCPNASPISRSHRVPRRSARDARSVSRPIAQIRSSGAIHAGAQAACGYDSPWSVRLILKSRLTDQFSM